MKQPPTILCVNPWIHDFAAYDFWARPLGLLSLAAILKAHGCRVFYIDCTDRFHPRADPPADPPERFGRGPYRKTRIQKPSALRHIPRHFSRYGIDPEWFLDDLRGLPRPDLVLVTSIMTYWYTGAHETIGLIKQVFPGVPVVLGGLYAQLCEAHARATSPADAVAPDVSDLGVLKLVEEHTGTALPPRFDPADPDDRPFPALELQSAVPFVPLQTTVGCPFSCPYCASRFLHPTMSRRSPSAVVREIELRYRTSGMRDFVFYDDAFLVNAEAHAVPMLEELIGRGLPLRFHTPNALHVREINTRTASLMRRAGFETIRLGLETADFENRKTFDAKVTGEEFARAVVCLKEAGFSERQIGAYLLVGLPGQSLESMLNSIAIVTAAGITPIPTYYTPIPHTALWTAAAADSPFDLEAEPLLTNNAVMPCLPGGFSWDVITRLRSAGRKNVDTRG
ncbi:MAG: radical SAM protein [Thermodesulfobacteriota bacterium]